MKKISLISLFILFQVLLNLVLAQQDPFEPVQSKWELTQTNLELNFYNSDYCDYYLVSSRNKELWVSPGKNNLVSVAKESAAKYRNDPTFMPNSFRTFKGYFPNKINPDFLYSLPVKSGDSVRYVVDTSKEFYTYFFLLRPMDTVYAVRGGVMCKRQNQGLFNKRESIEDEGTILIYHTDRTFAQYQKLSKCLIREGEQVSVGQAIGLVQKKGFLSLTFFFLDKNKFADGNTRGLPHTHFQPLFHTSTGNLKIEEKALYTNDWSDDVITQEMTKREKKRYEKNKLKLAAK